MNQEIYEWQKSYLLNAMICLQKKTDKFNNLLFALFDCFFVVIIILLVQFIEAPIRMLIFKGRLKDKIHYWFDCWRRIYKATGKDEPKASF